MKKFKRNAIVASLVPLFLTLPTQAEDKIIAVQDFSSYYEGSGWTLLDDEYDIATQMSENNYTRRQAKAQFIKVIDGEAQLMFDARWTRKTLKLMYPEQFADALAKPTAVKRRLAIKALRAEACPVKIEVGAAATYGVDDQGYEGNVTELDTDAGYCNNEDTLPVVDSTLGTVALRSFIPTVPGSSYSVEVKYRKRDYNWQSRGALSEEEAYRDLILRLGADVHQLPLSVADKELDQGFIVETHDFDAERFFTPINLRDSGHPDEFGVLIRSVTVTQKGHDAIKEQTCNSNYPAYSKGLKSCLMSNVEPELYGCDLNSEQGGAELTWNEGENISNKEFRSTAKNVFHNSDNKTFLSLGKGGSLQVQLKENNVKAACTVAGKTLALDEITWGTETFQSYPEKAVVKVKFVGCEENDDNGWRLLTNQLTDSKRLFTNEQFSHRFDSDNSCAITAIKIKDKSDKITEEQVGTVPYNKTKDGDGIDINNLRLFTSPQ